MKGKRLTAIIFSLAVLCSLTIGVGVAAGMDYNGTYHAAVQTPGNGTAVTPQPAPAAPAVAQEPIVVAKTPSAVKTKVTKNKVHLSWREVKATKKGKKLLKKIKSIQVQYSTDPTFNTNVAVKRVGKKKTEMTLRLHRKTTYYVRMRYIGKNGVSKWSSVKTVKTK